MTRVLVTIQDTMSFWNDELGAFLFNPDGYAPTNTYAYEVPDAWVQDGALTAEGYEKVFAHLYGPGWQAGNGDGSKYQVLERRSEVARPDDAREFKPIS